ncbi:SRPBCC family protein [Robertkochia solimangrovi]|uniref:SRPBCC family protein n=1 Tax=Robertkochia solimangrovi TaxID=2213046 RepID=UPI001180A92B|nr:SRPBCC family protein [Robertkochia solimangrovi]TRZ43728.1 transcriptional regulator [Robertkochia solimangrovi]
MKIFKYLIFLFLIALIGFAIYVAIQPDAYNVSRTHTIKAPVAVIHDYIDDYKEWSKWSPWQSQEPDAVITYGDPSKGEGATYNWKGEVLGEGSMNTIYSGNDSLLQEIHFIKPYESSSEVYWNLDPATTGTNVTWGMKGKLSFMEKAFMTFQGSMDQVIGKDYEKGLMNLDSVVTTEMSRYSIEYPGKTEYGGGFYLYQTTAAKHSELESHMERMFGEISSFMQQEGIPSAGMPFTLYEKWDTENKTAIFSACIPVSEKMITPAGSDILCGFIEPAPYFKTILKGDYDHLEEAWERAYEKITEAGFTADENKSPMEKYVNDSEMVPNPANWITEIYIPILPVTAE